jgi:hypothetical protein
MTPVLPNRRCRFWVGRGVILLALVGAVLVGLNGCNTGIPRRAAAVANHAAWMQDRLAVLGNRKLSRLVLPASHDAGMYRSNRLRWGQTQCLSIYGQLAYGVRWFDLRPKWTGKTFVTHHGAVSGPDLSEVLHDLRVFANEGRHELILLKFSHFSGINGDLYRKLADQLAGTLGPWLFRPPLPGKRLADVTLAEYVNSGPRILILVDGDYAINYRVPGIWIYSDWDSPLAPKADLRVYDVYSDTVDFARMAADQFGKFAAFDGKCRDPSTGCDLFLLSWTLTPAIKIWAASQPALHGLEDALQHQRPQNDAGKIMNLIYVDFVEFAHVTEAAIFENERLGELEH